jgi:hypothetical protein
MVTHRDAYSLKRRSRARAAYPIDAFLWELRHYASPAGLQRRAEAGFATGLGPTPATIPSTTRPRELSCNERRKAPTAADEHKGNRQERHMSGNNGRSDALVSDLLCTHPGDPANARYLVPLKDFEQEEMARTMADAIYSARADYFRDDITKQQADRVWEQCLIDSRRMLCDGDYMSIFCE